MNTETKEVPNKFPFNKSVDVCQLNPELFKIISREKYESTASVPLFDKVNFHVKPGVDLVYKDNDSTYHFYKVNSQLFYLAEINFRYTAITRFQSGEPVVSTTNCDRTRFKELFELMLTEIGVNKFDKRFLIVIKNMTATSENDKPMQVILTNETIVKMRDDEIESTINKLKAELIKRRLNQLKQSLSKLGELLDDSQDKERNILLVTIKTYIDDLTNRYSK